MFRLRIILLPPPNDIDGIIDDRPPPSIVVVVEALLDQVDVIDMSNPNMSRDDRARLTDEVLRCSIDDDDDDDDDDDRAIAHPHRRRRRRVFLFLGYLTSIGPAGTKGAPGLLRRAGPTGDR